MSWSSNHAKSLRFCIISFVVSSISCGDISSSVGSTNGTGVVHFVHMLSMGMLFSFQEVWHCGQCAPGLKIGCEREMSGVVGCSCSASVDAGDIDDFVVCGVDADCVFCIGCIVRVL